MQIYCERCRTPQVKSERKCLKCGAQYSAGLGTLVGGIVLASTMPLLGILSGQATPGFALKIGFWYVLPTLMGTAFLCDHHPKRRSMYVYGGTLLILASMVALLS